MTTQVFQCGGVLVYQLLCGDGGAIAKGNSFATRMKNYCYLIVNTLDKTAIALDAAWDVEGIFALSKELGVQVKGCIYTHCHFDHCGGEVDPSFVGRKIPPLAGAKDVEEAGGKVWAGSGDAANIQHQCGLRVPVSELNDGDAIDCGDLVLHILSTPGHTPGSVCVYAAPRCLSPRGTLGKSPFNETINKAEEGLLLTGDTLFVGSCGATHFPGGDQSQMLSSLARLSLMDASVVVCPGHAYSEPFTTIGRERRQNSAMLAGMQRAIKSAIALPPCVACGTAVTSCGPKGFIIGRKVRIRHLSSDVGKVLNGQHGVVQFFDEGKGRYAVKLLSSEAEKLIRPENVDRSCDIESAEHPDVECSGQEAVMASTSSLTAASEPDV